MSNQATQLQTAPQSIPNVKMTPRQGDVWTYIDGPFDQPNRKNVKVRIIDHVGARHWRGCEVETLGMVTVHESKLAQLLQREPTMILCTPKESLPVAWARTGFTKLAWMEFVELVKNLPMMWVERALAEHDESMVQWIPYCAITDGACYFTYSRGGTETRLHNKRTIGVGGHVDQDDGIPNFSDLPHYIVGALARELREEVFIPRSEVVTTKLMGIVMEQVSEVGRVHVGVMFQRRIASMCVAGRQEIFDPKWMNYEELYRNREAFEIWSQLCIDNML